MDHQPPPFFKRGPAPVAQLFFYATLSLALLFIDLRFNTLEFFRQGISLIALPLQNVAQLPLVAVKNADHYFSSISAFEAENTRLKQEQLDSMEAILRMQQLEAENEHLRKLLSLKERQKMSGRAAQILYAARDPFSQRIVIDKGLQDKIVAGQPAIDDAGLLGQVTRVFPFVSEVTLITDKDQAIPVQIARNGLRSVVFGSGSGQLELRFLPTNADVQNGDLIVTSGLDGVFLPGLPVARVSRIERETSYSFARIYCEPIAGVENHAHLVILDIPGKENAPEATAPRKTDAKPNARGSKKKKRTRGSN